MVSCTEHDYVELACLYHFSVKLTMKEGAPITGIALDTMHNESRQECILVSTDEIEIPVELSRIAKLEVLNENKHFNEVVFQ